MLNGEYGLPVIQHSTFNIQHSTFAFRTGGNANSPLRRPLAPHLFRPADRIDGEFHLLHPARISAWRLAIRSRVRRDRIFPLFSAGVLRSPETLVPLHVRYGRAVDAIPRLPRHPRADHLNFSYWRAIQ